MLEIMTQLLSAHNLSLSYVTREIFSRVDFHVETGDHIGLVGANGCGKTSLLKVIVGEQQPDQGNIALAKETQLAYMEQFLAADEDISLQKAVGAVFGPLQKMEQRLGEIALALEKKAEPALLKEQQRLQDAFAEQGGYTYAARLRATLLGLGFSERDLLLPISTLSGGQRSKAALAKVLLTPANFLLLDEPTNHLDMDSIQWLENHLLNYRGAFIVVSHDRYFLDKVTNRTWAMHHQRLECYPGNYSAHLEQRQSAEESIARRYSNQMKEIKRIQAIIEQQRRFNQARNYVTIASKEKQLKRLEAELVKPEAKEKTLHFHFNVPPPGGNDVLELHQVAKAFGEKKLFCQGDMLIRKGEKVFLLGPNGSGKSTLLKMIMGQIPADKGMVKLGVNIHVAYYDQLHGQMNGTESILDYFTNAYPRLTQTEIRTMLGSFLFSGDTVEKSIRDLSGGEKARLTLMELLLSPANFLLLDEPTNHLDIASREAIETALLEYPGAMLVVSHDRYLINRLADRIYTLTTTGFQESLGNYDDMLEKQGALPPKEAEEEAPAPNKSKGAEDYRKRKEEQAERRKAEKRLLQAEEKVAALEGESKSLEQQMNDPALAADYQQLMALSQQKEAVEEALLLAMTEWEEASLALENKNQ